MRWVWTIGLVLVLAAQQSRAQEEPPKPEEIKRLNDQLKAAQDRKNELAAENEKLVAKVADLQKQLDAVNASFAEKTFQWRTTHAAWLEFLKRYPVLHGRWQAFLQSDLLAAPGGVEWMTVE